MNSIITITVKNQSSYNMNLSSRNIIGDSCSGFSSNKLHSTCKLRDNADKSSVITENPWVLSQANAHSMLH